MATIDAMVRIYASLVENGRRTIASLPADYQAPVQALISPATAATTTTASTTTSSTAK